MAITPLSIEDAVRITAEKKAVQGVIYKNLQGKKLGEPLQTHMHHYQLATLDLMLGVADAPARLEKARSDILADTKPGRFQFTGKNRGNELLAWADQNVTAGVSACLKKLSPAPAAPSVTISEVAGDSTIQDAVVPLPQSADLLSDANIASLTPPQREELRDYAKGGFSSDRSLLRLMKTQEKVYNALCVYANAVIDERVPEKSPAADAPRMAAEAKLKAAYDAGKNSAEKYGNTVTEVHMLIDRHLAKKMKSLLAPRAGTAEATAAEAHSPG